MKGTLHWVSAEHAIDAEARLYDRLFVVEDPLAGEEPDFRKHLNPRALEVIEGLKLEPSLREAKLGERFQFERLGYFCVDPDSARGTPVFSRTITLKDSWAKIESKLQRS